MPELPEVQTTVNYLSKKLVGLRFKDVWTDPVKPTNVGYGASPTKSNNRRANWSLIKKATRNKKILNVKRRAKFIVIDIEGKFSLFIHQKISGHLLYGKWNMKNGIWKATKTGPLKSERENGYIRTIFFLNNRYQLAFSDLRRFGKIVLVKDDDLSKLSEIKNLGPEPLEIGFRNFAVLFQKKRGKVKQVLMDPFFIAGIGNIYADEILWYSSIHPLSRVENLKENEIRKIYYSMVKILKKAVLMGGSSVDDYRVPSGEKGEYQNLTKAYQKTGQKCAKKDGGIVERIKIGGRSAHFCPIHQTLR